MDRDVILLGDSVVGKIAELLRTHAQYAEYTSPPNDPKLSQYWNGE